jgi:hypothetical protein
VPEEPPKSKNMFSGLESGDSNDEQPIQTHAKEPVEDDGFITVEKKVKNIYKPKKTPALAIEGGKIYASSGGNGGIGIGIGIGSGSGSGGSGNGNRRK